jgi:hypothetical protein
MSSKMSSIQLESLVDLREKHRRDKHKKALAVAALFTGTAILSVVLSAASSNTKRCLLIHLVA